MDNLHNETNSIQEGRSIKRGGRQMKGQLRVDMTPMVDLGFILISFFIITTALNRPVVMDLYMPHDGTGTMVGQSNALSVMLGGNNRVFYYHGDWKTAKETGRIFETNLSYREGLGKVIREKQRWLEQYKKSGEGKNGLMILIKAGQEARYTALIEVLDEIAINQVKKYAVMKPDQEESDFLNNR